jgi:hypothetical protein
MNSPKPDGQSDKAESPAALTTEIFSVSATLVGLCLTVIGLVRIVVATEKTRTVADDLLVFDALLFLTACIAAYWTVRTKNKHWAQRLVRIADFFLHLGLFVMIVACGIIAYEIV